MPRNGSGVYSLPPGSTFNANTLAQSAVVNAINQDLANDLNTPRPIVAGGTGSPTKNFDDIVVFASKAGNYSAGLSDNNAIHRFTVAATVSLSPAGSLGSGWHYTIFADGAAVTIDPNASETVNGAATYTVPIGTIATIVCDGTAFYTALKPSAWEDIGDFAPSGASSLAITGLAPFKRVRITGYLTPSVTSTITANLSTDNGATYDTAANYVTQVGSFSGATVSAASSTGNAIVISGGGSVNSASFCEFELTLDALNITQNTRILQRAYQADGSLVNVFLNVGTAHLLTVAHNAIRFQSGSGTISGQLTVEGVRG